jgi:hypothetical protein
MHVTFGPRGLLQIDDAKICFRNFEGAQKGFDDEGDRNFSVIIAGGTIDEGDGVKEVDADEMADILRNTVNRHGAGWNVKIRAPRNEGDEPFRYLKVKLAYTDRSQPRVFVISNGNRVELDEDTVRRLDTMSIRKVDLDIRPYDGEGRFGPHRTAYLQTIYAVQEVDRFASRYAEEEYPEE